MVWAVSRERCWVIPEGRIAAAARQESYLAVVEAGMFGPIHSRCASGCGVCMAWKRGVEACRRDRQSQ